jgi:hypothetical protein
MRLNNVNPDGESVVAANLDSRPRQIIFFRKISKLTSKTSIIWFFFLRDVDRWELKKIYIVVWHIQKGVIV